MSEGSSGGRDSRPGEEPGQDGRQRFGRHSQDDTGANQADRPARERDARSGFIGRGYRRNEPGDEGEAQAREPGRPSGGADTYDMYRRGLDLLGRGSPAAAAQVLERAAAAEPESRSILEALARAQFDTRRYVAAAGSFRRIVDASPADDYARFGLGLALSRNGEHEAAVEHLALAAAMRPDLAHYTDALRSARATVRARRRAGAREAGTDRGDEAETADTEEHD